MRKEKLALCAIILLLLATVTFEQLQLKELTAENKELKTELAAQKAEIALLKEDKTNIWDNLVALAQQIGELQDRVKALNKTASNASVIYPQAP